MLIKNISQTRTQNILFIRYSHTGRATLIIIIITNITAAHQRTKSLSMGAARTQQPPQYVLEIKRSINNFVRIKHTAAAAEQSFTSPGVLHNLISFQVI